MYSSDLNYAVFFLIAETNSHKKTSITALAQKCIYLTVIILKLNNWINNVLQVRFPVV